jgi:hypothetical protein
MGEQKTAQMQWYVYSPGLVSKATFGDNYFRTMASSFNHAAHIMDKSELYFFVRAEFELFEYFLVHILTAGMVHCKGNAFAQGQHDDVTLEDGNGYTAYGLECMFDNRDWTLAFGFPRSTGHSAKAGKEQYEKGFATRTGYAPKQILSSIVSGCAALCVARAMGLDMLLRVSCTKETKWGGGQLARLRKQK